MQRIPTIVQKITDLVKQEDKNTVIDIDLMLDYTRVLYADLLEWRGRLSFTESLSTDNTAIPAAKTPAQKQEVINDPNEAPGMEETVAAPQPVVPPQILRAEPTPAMPQRDIRQSIGINDKYQFISELFSNNKEAYEDAIQYINTCATFQQALSWLDEHAYKQYYWNEDGEALQSFYSILSSFFAGQ
jgi:hypothetical protein